MRRRNVTNANMPTIKITGDINNNGHGINEISPAVFISIIGSIPAVNPMPISFKCKNENSFSSKAILTFLFLLLLERTFMS